MTSMIRESESTVQLKYFRKKISQILENLGDINPITSNHAQFGPKNNDKLSKTSSTLFISALSISRL